MAKDRYYYDKNGHYKGKSSGMSPTQMGGQGIGLLIVASLFFLQWASHNFWLLIGICSALLATYMLLYHAFRNFRELNFGIAIIFIFLAGSAYFEITHLHPDKFGYRTAQRLIGKLVGEKAA